MPVPPARSIVLLAMHKTSRTRLVWCSPLILWCLILGGSTIAGETTALPIQRCPATAVIRFAGTSTLHDFGGELPSQPFALVLSNGTWSASADVLSGRMATASEGRDRNMHRMLATNDFPQIHGEVALAPVPAGNNPVTNAVLLLTIRNQTNAVPVSIRDWKESRQDIRFHASWNVSLKQYGLKAPSVAGIVRVGDRVRLEADVVATKPSSTSDKAKISP